MNGLKILRLMGVAADWVAPAMVVLMVAGRRSCRNGTRNQGMTVTIGAGDVCERKLNLITASAGDSNVAGRRARSCR